MADDALVFALITAALVLLALITLLFCVALMVFVFLGPIVIGFVMLYQYSQQQQGISTQ